MDVTGARELRCAACGALLREDDHFCEQCGARQIVEGPLESGCRVCGADGDARDADGYCSVCGARGRTAGDRIEVDLAIAAAVSDRGRVHHRNEDAFRVEVITDRRVAAVVCDGISSASAGDAAARAAADAAAGVLTAAAADAARDPQRATLDAVAAAYDAVAQVPWTSRADRAMPSCTLVCALWRDDEIVVGSLGDSRAYWLDGPSTGQLTVDDSWAEDQVAEGRMSREQALDDPRSHSITHWVGADAPTRPPRIVCVDPGRPGRLLLCTDGLWNYMADTSAIAEIIDSLPSGASPAAVTRALTDTALLRGGRDNITVAVVDVDPS
jgi:serine/threonine protein phosphatase PrpC